MRSTLAAVLAASMLLGMLVGCGTTKSKKDSNYVCRSDSTVGTNMRRETCTPRKKDGDASTSNGRSPPRPVPAAPQPPGR